VLQFLKKADISNTVWEPVTSLILNNNFKYEIHGVIKKEHYMYKVYARQVPWLLKSEEIE
jgi:hypothetical protein